MCEGSTTIREARREDLPVILDLIADDRLGKQREAHAAQQTGELDPRYEAAFEAIDEDPNQHLIVTETNGEVSGVLQLTFIPGLSRKGAWRGHIEAVRVSSAFRGRGLGRLIMEHAIKQARARGCGLVQLTTDRRRPEALAFYEALGFENSHNGMKLFLEDAR